MKKIFYTSGVLTLTALALFTGCKKTNEGAFPSNPYNSATGNTADLAYNTPYIPTISGADGIMVAARVTNKKVVIISPVTQVYEYGIAKFTNTTGNFYSLVDAGTVTLDSVNLAKSSDFSYLSSTTTPSPLGLLNNVSWSIQGNTNTGVVATTYTNSNAFPASSDVITDWGDTWVPIYPRSLYAVPARPLKSNYAATHSDTLQYRADSTVFVADSVTHRKDSIYNRTVQYTIYINDVAKNIHATNADSVYIIFSDKSGFLYKRVLAATTDSTNFVPNDFYGYTSYDPSTFTLQKNIVKFDNVTSGTKNYYFLKMAAYIKYYQATR